MRRSRGGCLPSLLIFLLALVLCVCVIYKIADVSSGGKGASFVDLVLDRLGIGGKDGETQTPAQQDDAGSGKTERSTETEIFGDIPEATVMKIELTQEKLLSLLQEKLDASVPVQIDKLEISADSSVYTEVTLDRDAFLEYAQSSDSPLEGIQVLLLKFAPAQIEASATAVLSYNAAKGEVEVTPTVLHVQKLKLPVSLISGLIGNVFSVAIGDYAASFGYKLSAVEFYDGYMEIYLE